MSCACMPVAEMVKGTSMNRSMEIPKTHIPRVVLICCGLELILQRSDCGCWV